MMELFQRARWDQAHDFLASGDPPMIFRILALNTVFLMLFIVRRARGSRPLRESKLIGVQAILIGANFLVMFQRDLQWVFDRFS